MVTEEQIKAACDALRIGRREWMRAALSAADRQRKIEEAQKREREASDYRGYEMRRNYR